MLSGVSLILVIENETFSLDGVHTSIDCFKSNGNRLASETNRSLYNNLYISKGSR